MPSKTRVTLATTTLLLAVQGAHGFLSHSPSVAGCDRTRVAINAASTYEEDLELTRKVLMGLLDSPASSVKEAEPEPEPEPESPPPPQAAVDEVAAAGLQKMTVAQLKDQLRDRGMKVSGKKQDLIDRLLGKEELVPV